MCSSDLDFCVVLYNPRSHGRPDLLNRACQLLGRHKGPETPVGIVKNIGREGEQAIVTTLAELDENLVDMFSTAERKPPQRLPCWGQSQRRRPRLPPKVRKI